MQSGIQHRRATQNAFDVVVMAASAGGIRALLPLLESLPFDFPTPIVAVIHLPPAASYLSHLPEILQRKTALRVKWAEDGEDLLPGTVFLSPQDRLTVLDPETGRLVVTRTGDARMDRPTADPLFYSAGAAFGGRVVAVVLSGVLADGAAGSASIACAGGRVLAQISADAQFSQMPLAAMKLSRVGLAFDSISLAHVLVNLAMIPGAATWFAIGKAGVCAQLIPGGAGRSAPDEPGPGGTGRCSPGFSARGSEGVQTQGRRSGAGGFEEVDTALDEDLVA